MTASLSISGDRSPRLQAKRRIGEVASCDDTAAAVARCALKVHPAWAPKCRFAVTSGTITSKKVIRSRSAVDFKSTPLEPLALQARVVQLSLLAAGPYRPDCLLGSEATQAIRRAKMILVVLT